MNTLILLHWAALPCAFFLDLCLGDPARLHPVRLMGSAIAKVEPLFRRMAAPRLAGALFASTLVLVTLLIGMALCTAAWLLHPFLGFLVETVLLFYCLSARSLAQAALEIQLLLRHDKVDMARIAVSLIVGRDVDKYEAKDIARATVETVAENTVDGVVAPLFYAALGGAPLALAYKMVNTLDSMVGYKNEKYLHFGRFAARLDDAAGWIPARLGAALIAFSACCLRGLSGRNAWRVALRDCRKHASPNAGFGEAAFAGALSRRLNGPNSYGGVLVNKPWLGAEFAEVETRDIPRACRLLLATSTVTGLLVIWLRLPVLLWLAG